MSVSDLRHALMVLVQARAAIALAAALILVHAVIVATGGPNANAESYLKLGLRRDSLLGGGIWQVWTYALLHGSGGHLAANVAGLILLGAKVEFILGARRMLRVVFFGILGGAAMHMALSPGGPDERILVGMSAAVVALLLFITTISPESRMWPLPVRARFLGAGILIAEALLALMDPALGLPGFARIGRLVTAAGGASWFDIAHACHFGGGIAGWLCARWTLRQRITLASLRRARRRAGTD